MDEQEINREGLIAELKFRIAKLKDEIGYGEKGESKCSTESKDGSQKESSGIGAVVGFLIGFVVAW
jgi:ElaB/YqjD/DUF883 family membrane-anchored ribosome-binding protein